MMRRSRLVNFKEKFCVSHASTSRLRDVQLSKAFGAPCLKKLSLVVFDSNCSFKTVKCSFFNQIIVYQSFYRAPFTFSYFLLQGKVLFRTRQYVASEMFVCRKCLAEKHLCLVVFDSNCSFKTVKCSFFNQIIVYQSSMMRRSRLIMFYFKENFCVLVRVGNQSLVRCLSNYAFRRPCRKKLYLRLYLTQIVHSNGKKLFLQPNNC